MKLLIAFLAVSFTFAASLPTAPTGSPCAKPNYQNAVDTASNLLSNIHDAVAPAHSLVTINGNVTIEIVNHAHTCCNQENSTETHPPPKLPDGYVITSEGDGYITAVKFYSDDLIFNDARKICSREGAFLAYATSKEEEDSFLQIMDSNKVVDIWTGIHDFFQQSDYATILGEVAKEVAYYNWRPGQPDNAGGTERCTHFRKAGLNDITCTTNIFPFICKIKVPLSL